MRLAKWTLRRILPVLLLLLLSAFALSAQDLTESEPNDSFGTANQLAVGQSVATSINPRRDVDWYRFSVADQGELAVMVTSVPAEMDIAVRVWTANKEVLSDWVGPLALGGDTEARIDLPEAGTYYLEVRDGSDDVESPETFTITTNFTPSGDGAEPNDNFGSAAPLALDQFQRATVMPRRDVDWYIVAVEQHGALQIDITDVPADLDIVVRVWTANKDVLSDWAAPLAKGGDTIALVDLPIPGRYFLEVRDGNDDARSVQPYTLRVRQIPSSEVAEPNDSFGQAATLPLGQAIPATILPQRDVDWFSFEVDHHGELHLLVSNVPAELDVAMRVWTANKDVLAGWFNPLAKGGNTEAIVDLPSPGVYYLEVRDGNDDARSGAAFTLRGDFTPSPDDFEPNDNFGAAASLGVDRSVQATILPLRDADWFFFDVSNHGELQITVSDVPADLDINFRVWTANKDVMAGWFSPLAKGGNTEGRVDIPRPGRYFLEVRDGNDDGRSIDPYNLEMQYVAALDQGEPNDTIETAAPVVLDDTIPGNILPSGDSDWCVFEVTEPGELHILATNVAEDLAVIFRVYDGEKNRISDWFRPLAPGGDTAGVVDIAQPGTYYLELQDNSSGARSIQPYLLRFSMQPIDPTTVTLPGPTVAAGEPVTATGELSSTTKVTILTSGQVGPLGATLLTSEPNRPEWDSVQVHVPENAIVELSTVHIGVTESPPPGAPFGFEPVGNQYWMLDPDLSFSQPVSLTFPVPPGSAGSEVFIGHWTGGEWVDLGGTLEDGLITAATNSFSAFGIFCGSLNHYRPVSLLNDTGDAYVEVTYVSGPGPDPDQPENYINGCPTNPNTTAHWEFDAGEGIPMLLRPGAYQFAVAYPGSDVANSLHMIIKPGEGTQTIRLGIDGATSDDPATVIGFAGAQVTAGSNLGPRVVCSATVPPGVLLANLDPGAADLPSRLVFVDNIKLEQLAPNGDGVVFNAVATDPEGSALRPFWTVSGAGKSSLPIQGDTVPSGSTIAGQYTFRAAIAGTYTVYLTVYDSFNLFDECRWTIAVAANNRPTIEVISGRTWTEFGRLDNQRINQGVGSIPTVATVVRPGFAPPFAVPSLVEGAPPVDWNGSTLCPSALAGPFGALPEPDIIFTPASPVDELVAVDPAVSTDVTNRWLFPGRTCIWALVADADTDPLNITFNLPVPIFGRGTFFAAVTVPPDFHPQVPEGIGVGTLLRTYPQMNAYNAWVTALYNTLGVVPSVVWEAPDDPCLTGDPDTSPQNPCNSDLSRGGVTVVTARVTDGLTQPPRTGSAGIAYGPEAFQPNCGSVFFISSLTPVPSDPAARQNVEVTARLSPITQDCQVRMQVTGTDGYQDDELIATNKSGEATLFIPGGDEDVEDVVIAEVCRPVNPNATPPPPDEQCTVPGTGGPGWLIRMEVTYRF